MSKKIKILIAEHDKNDLEIIQHEITLGGINYESKIVENENDYIAALKYFIPDIILSDYSFPSFDGPTAFKIRQELAPDVPFIFVSGTIGEENAVKLIKSGVTDYTLKDKLFTLAVKIKRAIKEFEKKKEKIITDEKLKKANNLYAFISQVNKNIVRIKNEAMLFHNSCKLAVELGNFKNAWIGLFENENKEIFLVEQCGLETEDLGLFNGIVVDSSGPQENILHTGNYFISNDIQNDIRLETRKAFAVKRGLNSCIVMPVKKSGKIIGTFNLYSGELNFAGKDEVRLMLEVTADISFALDIFESKKKQAATDKKLLENEKLFRALIEKSADMQTLSSREGEFIYGSPSVTKVFGYSNEEFIHKSAFTFFHPEDLPDLMKNLEIILKIPGKSFSWQYRLLHKNGTWIWCEGTLTNMINDPAIKAFVTNFRNISEKKKAEQSNQFKANLLNTINQSVIATDLAGNINYWNKAAESIYGWSEEEAIGKNVIDLTPSKATQEQALQIMQELALGNSWSGEFEVRNKNGNVFPAFVTNTPIFDKKQELTGIIGISSNITERKKTELQLKNSETFNRGVLNSLSSHIAVVDATGAIVAVNESWKRFTGENGRTNLLGNEKNSNYFTVCEKSAAAGDEVASLALTGMKDVLNEKKSLFNLEYPCHSPKKARWFNMRVTKFENDQSMIVVAHENISERKLAEQNLSKSELRLNEAQAISHIGNCEFDFATNLYTWSDELYLIFGIKEGEVWASTELFLSFIHPEDLDEIKTKIDMVFTSLKATSFGFRFIRKDSVMRYGFIEQKFELDKNGKPARLHSVIHDVTDRKLAEEEREKMITNIVQHSKNLEQFASIVSHNLRAPVANILGLSNVLKNDISDEDRVKSQQFLFVATKQLDLVFKDLNKILEVKTEINQFKEPVYFAELIKDVELSIHNIIEKESVLIITDFASADHINSVKSYIYSIFYNIISNSIKYRQSGKTPVITIKSEVNEGKIKISFKDNGIGIDLVKHGDKIFGLYKRFHLHIEGKGMGLFMVKSQTETLGGNIKVKSIPGEGAEFIVELLQ